MGSLMGKLAGKGSTVLAAVMGTVFLLLAGTSSVWAAPDSKTSQVPTIIDMRFGDSGRGTRLVLEVSQDIPYKTFTLANPARFVVDLPAVVWSLKAKKDIPWQSDLITKVRTGYYKPDVFRIVVHSRDAVKLARAFKLKPQAGFKNRLVFDIVPSIAKKSPASAKKTSPVVAGKKPRTAAKKLPLIVIDPGHGGVDPGALSPHYGVVEKNIVLNFATTLKKQFLSTGKFHAKLTRTRDVYIPLRERVAIARQHKADLFISIHADSVPRSKVRGLSVYTLSEVASDKMAAALASQENRSDIIAGVNFFGESEEVTKILIDLAQRETKNLSVQYAKNVLSYVDNSARLLPRPHRFAGFRVLTAPDIPSVLIELGFLTNKEDAKLLNSLAWRDKVARRIVEATQRYFARHRIAQNVPEKIDY